MKQPTHPNQQPSPNGLATFAIVAASSILFCSKGVVVKLAFSHGVDALTILTLRMAMALPFFVGIVVVSSRGNAPLAAGDWLRLAGLGFIGYYVSSLVNFTGLQFVSVALERVILYSYPTLVLIFSAVFLRTLVPRMVWVAAGVSWIGIATAYAGELGLTAENDRTALGAGLIFLSAVTYAAFILLSGGIVGRVGALRFTGIAVGFSCVFVIVHALVMRGAAGLLALPGAVYGEGAVLAIFGTVLPSLLLSTGLRRAGAQRFAVISTIGPVTTLLLAWAVLSEKPTAFQWIGFGLALAGGLGVSLLKTKAR
jgi:drug/metabolite transporter (DMT)-like permease